MSKTPDSDELDEATGPPTMAKAGLRWQDDPEHAQAVADVVARAHGNIGKFGLEAGRTRASSSKPPTSSTSCKRRSGPSSTSTRSPPRWSRAWIPGRDDLQGAPASVHGNHVAVLAELEVELENAGILEPADNITDRCIAFAPAVVAPKKHKQGDRSCSVFDESLRF